jgi:hypothetical protein
VHWNRVIQHMEDPQSLKISSAAALLMCFFGIDIPSPSQVVLVTIDSMNVTSLRPKPDLRTRFIVMIQASA